FLWSAGNTISIARMGDVLPGGGHMVSASFNPANFDMNSKGDVAFNALLDTGEEGVYLYSKGALSLVAKTGTVIPGVGTIGSMEFWGAGLAKGNLSTSERGRGVLSAALGGGGGVWARAPRGGGGSSAKTAPPITAVLDAPAVRTDLPEILVSLVPGSRGS